MKNKKIKLLLAASAVAIAPAVIAISCGDQTPAPAPTPGNPNTNNPQNPNPGNPENPGTDNTQNSNPGNPGGGTVDPVEAAKTEAKTAIDAAAELSDSVKEALKRQVEATTTESAARDLKAKAEALVSAVKALSGSVTAAKAVKDDAEYSKVTDTLRTDLEAKLTAATALLEDGTKLANLDASSNLDTTKASLESAKTALDAAVSALMPELTFVKTKASAVKTASELEPLVNSALKAELERQVNELTKEQAAQATTMLVNLTSLKESLESLQTLVSDGLKMQVDYPQKYYDADNKEAFDATLLKASSVFSAFQWTNESIMVPAPEGDALPNPRAWTKAREKSEFKLQNFLMAPAQAAAPTPTQPAAVESTLATVRLANGESVSADGTASREAQTTPDLASTASYLKTLETELKAQTAALNGDTTTNKTAYYKPVNGRTLYWDGFMPKIVLNNFDKTWEQNSENERKIRAWFDNAINWAGLSEQLTKKLGAERFKNVVLSNPQIIFEDVMLSSGSVKFPKVTFTVTAKDGYQLASGEGTSTTLELKIRVLYSSSDPNALLLPYQEASSSAAPSGANTADHAKTIKDVNVYLNYTGPAIVLDATLPVVGKVDNTTTNGTSNVTDDLNTKFKDLVTSDQRTASLFFQAIQKYVNTFDPKYPANSISDQKNGVTWARVENKALKIANLNNPNAVFVQQMKDDSEAVYLPVIGVANNRWLNTFLIRIPLTKFVKPLTVFTATPASTPTQDSSASNTSPQTTT
ncbi:GA module-containing protein [Mycoplasmopsis synoviae]|nr:GA module-containing protein [Mycoplasmopsis synoviae]